MKRTILPLLTRGLLTLAVLCGISLLAFARPVTADLIADGVCRGILSAEGNTTATTEGEQPVSRSSCFESDGEQSFGQLVRRVINIFSIVVGAVSVIMIIIGGFRYIISGGDSAGVSSAKNTIMYAIIGLVIVLFAQVIIRFVYSNITPTPSSSNSTPAQQAE